MAPNLEYRDVVTIYQTVKNAYGTDSLPSSGDVLYSLKGMLVQVMNFGHSNYQDGISAATILHLPPDDPFLLERGFRIEGLIVKVDPYGAPADSQYFRLGPVNVARDVLLNNEVHNVECALTKVAGLNYAS